MLFVLLCVAASALVASSRSAPTTRRQQHDNLRESITSLRSEVSALEAELSLRTQAPQPSTEEPSLGLFERASVARALPEHAEKEAFLDYLGLDDSYWVQKGRVGDVVYVEASPKAEALLSSHRDLFALDDGSFEGLLDAVHNDFQADAVLGDAGDEDELMYSVKRRRDANVRELFKLWVEEEKDVKKEELDAALHIVDYVRAKMTYPWGQRHLPALLHDDTPMADRMTRAVDAAQTVSLVAALRQLYDESDPRVLANLRAVFLDIDVDDDAAFFAMATARTTTLLAAVRAGVTLTLSWGAALVLSFLFGYNVLGSAVADHLFNGLTFYGDVTVTMNVLARAAAHYHL